MHINKHYGSWAVWAILIIALLVPLSNLLTPGYFLGHDTIDHVARIANFYANLQEGVLVPRWAGNLNWGYGHPILMFLYPLPSYVASLFISLGFSFINATKIVFALGFFLSGITMFVWIRSVWGDKAGLVAAMLYTFAPYRFVDLYVRGAIGENFFFIWPPLVCYFLFKLITTKRILFIVGGVLSTCGMILSHNALSIMLMPFIGLYALILLLIYRRIEWRTWIHTGLVIVLGFGLSAFFWIPAFLEGKYTLRDVVIQGEIFDRFESIQRLLYSEWSHGGTGTMSVQVGILHWGVVILSVALLIILIKKRKRTKKKDRSLLYRDIAILVTSIVLFIFSLFMILEYSSAIYKFISVFQKFQFPWRWLSLSVFLTAVLGGIVTYYLSQKKQYWFAGIIVGASILFTYPFWQADGYKELPNSFFSGIYNGTTDTGESAPIWSVRFMEEQPAVLFDVVEGEGEITELNRGVNHRRYSIVVMSESARILENTLYFPGWHVTVDRVQIPDEQLMFHDPNYRGLINFNLPQGEYDVEIMFTNTKIRAYAGYISLLSFGVLVLIGSWSLIKKTK